MQLKYSAVDINTASATKNTNKLPGGLFVYAHTGVTNMGRFARGPFYLYRRAGTCLAARRPG